MTAQKRNIFRYVMDIKKKCISTPEIHGYIFKTALVSFFFHNPLPFLFSQSSLYFYLNSHHFTKTILKCILICMWPNRVNAYPGSFPKPLSILDAIGSSSPTALPSLKKHLYYLLCSHLTYS